MKMGTANPVREAGLAYVDLIAGDLPAAEARFNSSVSITPDMIPSRVGLVQIYESRRDRDKAFAELREILARAPGHRWATPRFEALRADLVRESTAAAREAYASGNRETAKREFLKALAYAPDTPAIHLELARLYRQDKDTDAALPHYRAAVEGQRADKALLREYAEFLAEAGELGLSLEILERLAAAEPKDAAVGKRVEEIKSKLGVYEVPSQYDGLPALEAITREDLAALIGVKFGDVLAAPGPRTGDPDRHRDLLGPALHRQGRLARDHDRLGQPHLPTPPDHQPGRPGRRRRPPHRRPPAAGGQVRAFGRDAPDPDRRRLPGQFLLRRPSPKPSPTRS
ncbi:MAG: hypothetical protein MZV64_13225 [Ignavibacteriales bacterium]|nr:hypothetical protein [Ignavibacteriales bacterium]